MNCCKSTTSNQEQKPAGNRDFYCDNYEKTYLDHFVAISPKHDLKYNNLICMLSYLLNNSQRTKLLFFSRV